MNALWRLRRIIILLAGKSPGRVHLNYNVFGNITSSCLWVVITNIVIKLLARQAIHLTFKWSDVRYQISRIFTNRFASAPFRLSLCSVLVRNPGNCKTLPCSSCDCVQFPPVIIHDGGVILHNWGGWHRCEGEHDVLAGLGASSQTNSSLFSLINYVLVSIIAGS